MTNLAQKMKAQSFSVQEEIKRIEKEKKLKQEEQEKAYAATKLESDKKQIISKIEEASKKGLQSCYVSNFNKLNVSALIEYLESEGFRASYSCAYDREDRVECFYIDVSW